MGTSLQANTALATRDDGALQIHQSGFDAISIAVSKGAEAEVKARFAIAERNPRQIFQFETDFLKDCERPLLAKVAKYRLKRGQKKDEDSGKWVDNIIEGPTIRLLESAARAYRNISVDTVVVYDDDSLQIQKVSVTDLETNYTQSQAFSVRKEVEKRGFKAKGSNVYEPPAGREVISQRLNSEDIPTYTVVATMDELRSKIGAEHSRIKRNLLTQVLPRHIIDEGLRVAALTVQNEDARDPDAAKRELVSKFSAFNVNVSEIEMILGHDIDHINPVGFRMLREVYVALSTGEATWNQIAAEYAEEGNREKKRDAITDQLKKAREAAAAAKSGATGKPADTAKPAEQNGDTANAPAQADESKVAGAKAAEEPKQPTQRAKAQPAAEDAENLFGGRR